MLVLRTSQSSTAKLSSSERQLSQVPKETSLGDCMSQSSVCNSATPRIFKPVHHCIGRFGYWIWTVSLDATVGIERPSEFFISEESINKCKLQMTANASSTLLANGSTNEDQRRGVRHSTESCTITGRKCNSCAKLNKQNTLSQIVIFVKENMLYQKRFTSTSSGNT